MHEDEWKVWRKISNPGFSQPHLISLVSDIVRETRAYRDIPKEYAEAGTMFRLDEATLWFTMDLNAAIALYVLQDLGTRSNMTDSDEGGSPGFQTNQESFGNFSP